MHFLAQCEGTTPSIYISLFSFDQVNGAVCLLTVVKFILVLEISKLLKVDFL